MCVTPSEPVLCSVFTSGNEIPPHFVLNTEAALYQLEIAHNAALPSLPLTCRHLTSHAPNSRLDHHRQRIKMVYQLVHRTTVTATGAKKVIWHASTLTDGSLHKLNTSLLGTTVFDEYSHVAGEKALGHCSFIVNLCQYIFCLTNVGP